MNLNPSNSKIRVEYDKPLTGAPQAVLELLKIMTSSFHNDSKVVIGYASHEWARPRFKGYEKHNGLDVFKIKIIYETNNIEDATEVESNLIKDLQTHPNNCNIRQERRRERESRHDKYYVYLALGH